MCRPSGCDREIRESGTRNVALVFDISACSTSASVSASGHVRRIPSGGCGSGICIPCQFFAQENKLPHMVISMASAAKKNHESFPGLRFALGRVSRHPILGLLLLYRRQDHGHGLIERLHYFRFVGSLRFCEFPVAVAEVACPRHARPDVVIQISRHVQYQVSNAVSVRERVVPELLLRQRVNPFMDMLRNISVVAEKVRRNRAWKISHQNSSARGSARPTSELRAPPSPDHSCKPRLPSSQKRRARSREYSPPDRPARPPHRRAFPLRAFRSCRPIQVNPHRPKFRLSARRSVSSPNPPSGETLPCCVHAHRPQHPCPGRSSRPSRALSGTSDCRPRWRPSPWRGSAAEYTSPCLSAPVSRAGPSVSVPGTFPSASSC